MGTPSAVDPSTASMQLQPAAGSQHTTLVPMTPMKSARPHRLATADDLPNELYLYIFPLLALPSLVTARNVCRRWRALVHASSLCPIRRRYMDVYVRAAAAADAPGAASRRGSTVAESGASDAKDGGAGAERGHAKWRREDADDEQEREAYIQQLERLAVRVPDELVLWVREWPRARGWLVPTREMAASYTTGCVSASWSGICGPGPSLGLVGEELASASDDIANRSGVALKEGAAPHWWSLPMLLRVGGPYIKSVTFSGRGRPLPSLLGSGTVLHATRILPAELAELALVASDMNFGFGEEDETVEEAVEAARVEGNTSIELMLLCLGEGRCYVLDGKGGGEELVGTVYSVHGSYTMQRDKIVARSWVDLVEKDLEVRYNVRPTAKREVPGRRVRW